MDTQFELEFTKHGEVYDQNQVTALLDGLPGITDLLVLSHGWNNDAKEARELYDTLTSSLCKVSARSDAPDTGGRKMGQLRVLWPSKRFSDTELIPGGGAAGMSEPEGAGLGKLLNALAHAPERLGGRERNTGAEKLVKQAQSTLGSVHRDAEARRDFVAALRALVANCEHEPDDGVNDFFERDALELFNDHLEYVPVPSGTSIGGAASGDGGAVWLGDVWNGARAAARRLANLATYYQMKSRAGQVGTQALAPVLKQIREQTPSLRLHLVGHSFGGRLVTAAANSLPPQTEGVSMTLLQAAFSHYGLARGFNRQGVDGSFRGVLSERRISGPILITHTKRDRAVGIAYPLASRVARDGAAWLGDEDDPYGGMGRNGAQRTPEVDRKYDRLRSVGGHYEVQPGAVYNLRGGTFIKHHGDVAGEQVAWALLHAIAAVPTE